ncbi:hypothetical protein PUN28_013828 [Cardiocondyla obscurior]|uniref:Uncharacterized protein n=1 Tax=Cardiocondyla obscurior TaxID=286306 RepID=A0AAW2F7E0_9HYME
MRWLATSRREQSDCLVASDQSPRVDHVSKRAIDMPAGKSRDVWPATRQIVELNFCGRRMPGMEKGSHVLHMISSIGGFDTVGWIRHNEYTRRQITRVSFKLRKILPAPPLSELNRPVVVMVDTCRSQLPICYLYNKKYLNKHCYRVIKSLAILHTWARVNVFADTLLSISAKVPPGHNSVTTRYSYPLRSSRSNL